MNQEKGMKKIDELMTISLILLIQSLNRSRALAKDDYRAPKGLILMLEYSLLYFHDTLNKTLSECVLGHLSSSSSSSLSSF